MHQPRNMNLEQLKYPIGKYKKADSISKELLNAWISELESFPKNLASEVELLSDEQLDTPYRPEGWTIRQVVHHCADSHMNSLMRFKLALTEDQPTIKPYREEKWAELEDSSVMPIASSLLMIEGIHNRWTYLLSKLTDEQLSRVFIHPDHGKSIRIDENVGLYAWHCRHHLAHITETKKRYGWS